MQVHPLHDNNHCKAMAEYFSVFSLLFAYLTIGNVIISLMFLYFLFYLKILHEFRGMPPGPRASCLPFVGNLMIADQIFAEDGKDSFHQKYGGLYSVRIGDYKIVVATSGEAIYEALVKKTVDFSGRPPLHGPMVQTLGGKDIAFGDGGQAWKYHRKLFTTALRQYLTDVSLLDSRIQQQAEKLLKYIVDQDSKSFDPENIIATCIGDVICSYVFGNYFNSSRPEFYEFLGVLDDALALELDAYMFIFDMFSISKHFPLATYKRNQDITNRMFAVLKQVFENRQKDFKDEEDLPVTDFITSLLKVHRDAHKQGDEKLKEYLHEDYVLNSILDMFSAGYETTTTTLKWAILFLVNFPQYQMELQDALDKVVGQDRMPSLNDRPHLNIFRAFIMETLRVGNTSPQTIPHYSIKDTTLCGYRIPKDTMVVIGLETLHRDSEIWENPDVFYPHRHLDSKGEIIESHGILLPFGAGQRVCAGKAFANALLFAFLACMLQKYTFVAEEGKPPPSIKAARGSVLSPLPYKIRAVLRENQK